MLSQPTSSARRTVEVTSRGRYALRTIVVVCAALFSENVLGQMPAGFTPPLAAATPPATPAIPEPIYWKQHLFLIPYQWSSTADPNAAQAVWLIVSKDRGGNWQKISEARPQVKAFNYHAERDGEYWFAIRTIDRQGQAMPPVPYQPELRVIVDTSMPRVESLTGQLRPDGALQMQWRGSDANLDPASWKIEVQQAGSDTWYPVPPTSLSVAPSAATVGQAEVATDGQAVWQPPAGAQPRALRATVYDRAGNSASFGATITALPAGAPLLPAAPTQLQSGDQPPTANGVPPVENNLSGWVSASTAAAVAATQVEPPAANQTWPVGAVAHQPFQHTDPARATSSSMVTSVGAPGGVGAPLVTENPYLGNAAGTDSQFAPLEPFRQSAEPFRRASLTRLPAVDGSSSAAPFAAEPTSSSLIAPGWHQSVATGMPIASAGGANPPAGIEPKRVGSRTFSLEYEVEDVGRWGVSKVELWGTRDGGQSWRCFATDADARSPLVVTVDDEGLYGFCIVVESTGGIAAIPPASGDAPELWVAVDLRQPVAELTAIEPGAGNLADHLILKWRAADDNFDDRPIALFYSSRPGGPWSAIATNLANTGEFAWQVQRHVPERFYLRLEARDTAGNLAAFQTREPVELATPEATARLRGAEPVGPTATSPSVDYR